jgi:predicted MFS family arabinose efflux permease
LTSVRQVTVFCAIAALAEVLFYTAIAPLLPSLDRELGLGHVGGGLLVATYGLGFTLGTYPAVLLTARRGPRATMTAGMFCVAAGTLTFAVSSQSVVLFAGRTVAGFGSALFFTGAIALAAGYAGTEHRGATIGTLFSGYDAGSAAGPLLGTAAAAFGRGPVFGLLAVVQLAMAAMTRWAPQVTAEPRSDLRAVLGYLRSERVRLGVWITMLPEFAIGMLVVSGAYRIDEAGGSALVIAGAFIGVAVLSMIGEPIIGRISDDSGQRLPLIVLMLLAVGSLFMLAATPGLALLFDAVEERGGSVGEASFLSNLFNGPADAFGAVLAGLFHNVIGADLSFGVLSLVALISACVAYRFLRPGNPQTP